MFGIELQKAVGRRNPWFWGVMAGGMLLACLSAVHSEEVFGNTLALSLQYWNTTDPGYSVATCFSFWLPVQVTDVFTGVFLLVWPLIAAIPYAWAWNAELRSGVLAQEASRASRRTCYVAKALAAFVAAALSVAVPLVANLVMCACIAPAAPNWISDVLYLGVWCAAPLSSLFYCAPWAYCAAWTAIVALVAGLWGTTVCAISTLGRSFVETMVATYLSLHVLAFVGRQAQTYLSMAVGSDAGRSALPSLNLFSVVGVRSDPDATQALILAIAILVLVSVLIPALALRRDVL